MKKFKNLALLLVMLLFVACSTYSGVYKVGKLSKLTVKDVVSLELMDLQNIWSDGYLSPDEAKRVEFYKSKLNPVIRVWEKTHNLYIKSIIVWRDSGEGKEKVEELQNELSELTSQVIDLAIEVGLLKGGK